MEEELKKYDVLKKELQELYEAKGEAAKFRAKCAWLEKGERPTKYFFNLEKRNYNKKVIFELEDEANNIITSDKDILLQIENYYSNLYSSNICVTEEKLSQFSENLNLPRLSNEDSDNLEGLLTYEECKATLASFKNDKSPGEDGFSAEFYSTFFDLIGEDLVNCLNAGYEKGKLTISQRRGIITLIPKPDSDLNHLHNWRPITLLNIDYKIASKAIARRMDSILQGLIHPDQTGFVKGRYIGENIRLISDIMEQTRRDDTPGIFLSLDFHKAFDSLDWSCIQHSLKLYNFGDSLRRWVSVFYTEIESAVVNNGFATNWIKPSTGVRQGCPLSPYLFILTAELMSNKIRQSSEVKGVSLFNSEIKLSQFADDTNLFCADLASVERGLDIIASFGDISGLKLNIKKTKAMWLGKLVNRSDKPLGLKWIKDPVKILGIFFSYDSSGNNLHNFDLKIQKLQTNLDIWCSRDLTIFGRVLIIKAMGVSSLIHSASNIDVPKEIIGKVQSRLFKFLWKNKRDKIKRTSLYQDYKDGGLRMIDIETMVKALRLAWIPRLLKIGSLNWKTVPDYYFKKYGGLGFLLKCNYRVEDFKDIPRFYRDILLFFNELKSLYDNRNDHETILFNNKKILIGGQPFLFQEWLNREIKTIMDLLDSEGNVLSFAEFKSKFQLKKTTFLHFFQVVSAIPSHLLQRARELKVSLDDSKFYDDSASFQINENSYLDLINTKYNDLKNN